jgi:hypothetical protein
VNAIAFADRRVLFVASLLVAVVGAAFTYVVLDPKIGFDDANITQVYARHIAQGHGYVYNVGGERVEGSTSILWTLINAAAFAISDTPETLLAGVSLLMTALTLYFAGLATLTVVRARTSIAPLATIAASLVFPGFFGWMVWSLMDMTLWVLLTTALFVLLVRQGAQATKGAMPWLWLCLVALLLPVTRPEGIALTTGIALVLLLRSAIVRDGWPLAAFVIGISGAISVAAVTLWRLSYFGYPFPNTFYAKTSDDIIQQTVNGIRYMLSYLEVSQNVLLVGLFCVAVALILLLGTRPARHAALIAAATLVGAVLIYTLLGGDHFGSHRFLLIAIPLGLPVVTVGLRLIVADDSGDAAPLPVLAAVVLALPFVLVGAVSARAFIHDTGGIRGEFGIAEDSRLQGTILNALPGKPVVGVVVAGGIRMGYDGDVQDLMGLNWTVMAHAEPDDLSSGVINHSGFNQNVFWISPPDIFVPRSVECPSNWVSLDGFLDRVTDEISNSPAFRDQYALTCYQGLVFHVSYAYLQGLAAQGIAAPFDLLPPVPAP